MKKTILALTITVLSLPLFASAHPNLSQGPISTGRPPITEPTQPTQPSQVSVSVSSGSSITPEGIYYRNLEALKNNLEQLVQLYVQLANLK